MLSAMKESLDLRKRGVELEREAMSASRRASEMTTFTIGGSDGRPEFRISLVSSFVNGEFGGDGVSLGASTCENGARVACATHATDEEFRSMVGAVVYMESACNYSLLREYANAYPALEKERDRLLETLSQCKEKIERLTIVSSGKRMLKKSPPKSAAKKTKPVEMVYSAKKNAMVPNKPAAKRSHAKKGGAKR